MLLGLSFVYGCNFYRPPLHEEKFERGRFVFREAASGYHGFVVGAPHGDTDPGSDRLARAISDRTGVGLVIATGFNKNRLGVNRPLARSYGSFDVTPEARRAASVYQDFKKIVNVAAVGNLEFYIGIHTVASPSSMRLEVIASGFSFEEAAAIKRVYDKLRDEAVQGDITSKLEMVLDPLATVAWPAEGVKHHGILLAAEKGMMIRLPCLSAESEKIYTEILSAWAVEVARVVRAGAAAVPRIEIRPSEFGKLELIASRKDLYGVVIGAPHGSFDQYTAELAKQLSFRTGLAAVIAKGFTPTEADGWRINVNRPTERIFSREGFEIATKRATEVYRKFKNAVVELAGGRLQLYIDLHQYGRGDQIQVATVGISRYEAMMVKDAYREIGNKLLGKKSAPAVAALLIEPLDEIEIGAWPVKAEGILSVSEKGLHFEIPQIVLLSAESREVYSRLLAELIDRCLALLLSDPKPPGGSAMQLIDQRSR